jgi:hypothetical protein
MLHLPHTYNFVILPSLKSHQALIPCNFRRRFLFASLIIKKFCLIAFILFKKLDQATHLSIGTYPKLSSTKSSHSAILTSQLFLLQHLPRFNPCTDRLWVRLSQSYEMYLRSVWLNIRESFASSRWYLWGIYRRKSSRAWTVYGWWRLSRTPRGWRRRQARRKISRR